MAKIIETRIANAEKVINFIRKTLLIEGKEVSKIVSRAYKILKYNKKK